jgi:cytochrome c-type biogenesis protein CcmH/NrfG
VVKQDYKTALKYYDKAIKLHPDNTSLINNALIAARKMNNAKLEKKYRKMLEK